MSGRAVRASHWAVLFVAGFVTCAAYHHLDRAVAEAAADDAAAPAGELRATRIVLVDEEGRRRAVLGEFAWQDIPPQGTKIEEGSPAAGLAFYSADGHASIQLGSCEAGTWLMCRGKQGQGTFGAAADGAGMGFWCPHDTLRFGLGNQLAGNAGLTFNDLQGRQRMGLGMPPHAGFSMGFHDEEGNRTWGAP